jgi:hypothetical protein
MLGQREQRRVRLYYAPGGPKWKGLHLQYPKRVRWLGLAVLHCTQ